MRCLRMKGCSYNAANDHCWTPETPETPLEPITPEEPETPVVINPDHDN
jgi:hypothetical protein